VTTPRTALITGLSGQDGSFLAELLLEKGYAVTGVIRGDPEQPMGYAEHLRGRVQVLRAQLLDADGLRGAIELVRPDEIYHLAAPAFVPDSWARPSENLAAIAGSTATILETVRDVAPDTRFFLAGSASMYGEARESPQNEDTPCRPTAPYGLSKLAAHNIVGALRAHDDLFACSGILFNHDSERRPDWFVMHKITRAAAAIKLGLEHEVMLGDLHAVRDWSYAGDIMHGAWLMLQHDRADDYVLASGVGHTVTELLHTAFGLVGLDPDDYVRVKDEFVRPTEGTPSVGDPAKARRLLGWEPRVSFEQLVEQMLQADMRLLQGVASSS
jgi:GDPmannose 4,6-dehydratase